MNDTPIYLGTENVFAEGIRLMQKPIDTDMGIKPTTTFIVSVSAETTNYEDLRLGLYATNSQSIPYTSELDNNWSRLKPQWRFTDVDGNIFEESAPINWHTEVLREGTDELLGAVGELEYNYIDDLPSKYAVPVMLHMKLDTFAYHDKVYNSTLGEIFSF